MSYLLLKSIFYIFCLLQCGFSFWKCALCDVTKSEDPLLKVRLPLLLKSTKHTGVQPKQRRQLVQLLQSLGVREELNQPVTFQSRSLTQWVRTADGESVSSCARFPGSKLCQSASLSQW